MCQRHPRREAKRWCSARLVSRMLRTRGVTSQVHSDHPLLPQRYLRTKTDRTPINLIPETEKKSRRLPVAPPMQLLSLVLLNREDGVPRCNCIHISVLPATLHTCVYLFLLALRMRVDGHCAGRTRRVAGRGRGSGAQGPAAVDVSPAREGLPANHPGVMPLPATVSSVVSSSCSCSHAIRPKWRGGAGE